jgi:hypothetical protein
VSTKLLLLGGKERKKFNIQKVNGYVINITVELMLNIFGLSLDKDISNG